jgi:hypothetical protein
VPTDNNTFDGNIDDVRLWGDIRTPAEIADNYTDKLTGSEGDLEGYWPIDAGSGATVDDDSVNNNDGTITGALWFAVQNESLSYYDSIPIVPDNQGADTIMFGNGAMLAVEHVRYWIETVPTLWLTFPGLPTPLLTDQSGTGTDPDYSFFPSDTPGLDFLLAPATASPTADIPPDQAGEIIGPVPVVENFSSGEGSYTGGFILFQIISSIADPTRYPYDMMITMVSIGMTIMIAILFALIYKEALPTGIAIVLCLIVFWKMGTIPAWMAILFAIGPLPFFLVWKKANP